MKNVGGRHMKVIRADAAGACYGVQRALDMAFEASRAKGEVKSLGPLIHNPQVINELRDKGVEVIDDPHDAIAGTVIIRSHGIGPDERRALKQAGVEVVDATCPYVLRAQKAGERLSRDIGAVIVVGESEHPEVEAIRSYALQAGGLVWVVDSADALPEELPNRIGVVVQTTQKRRVLDEILEALERRGCEVTLKDTICAATAERQDAARTLAASVDAMIVIGGHNSSNTTRLYEICKAICSKTYHIETKDELEVDALVGCSAIGVTAGASTPEKQIVEIETYLEGL
jgi:4-hydroxy-3-methylbut-2-enyl diphosphate reductase